VARPWTGAYAAHMTTQPPVPDDSAPVQGFADANGARLWYEVAGAGPPLVMLHGHLIDSGQWDGQFAEFAGEFRTVRYDARGFGRSDQPAEPFAYHDDLRALLGFLGIEHAFLMGCSGGGATAVDLALSSPEMVRALVLVGTGLSGYQFEGERPAKIVALRAAQERGDIAEAVELGLQLWTDGERRRPDQVEAGAREHTREMMTRLFERPDVDVEARSADPPAVSRLAEIGAPTLVIVGGDDWHPIHDIAGRLEREVPGARRVVIPDAGHHPNMEHSALFNETVLTFLRGVGTG
jgi:3-oxoadipate enol-lactonase